MIKMKSRLTLFLTVGVFAIGGIASFLSDKTINDSPNSILGSQVNTESQVAQPVKVSPTATPKAVKASDRSLKLATYIFAAIKGNQRTEFINKFSNGKNDLVLAVNNLALLLDSKPELLAAVEKVIAQDLVQRSAKNSQEDNSTAFDDLEHVNISNIGGFNDSSGNSSSPPKNDTYIGGTQGTNVGTNLPKDTKPKTGFIQKGSQYTDSLGNTYFYNDDGTTGTAHTDSLGNTYYGDSVGRSSITTRDSLGNSYTTDNQGNSIDTSRDSLGNTYYYGNNGLSGSSYNDSLGNTYYNDNYGNNMLCQTDSLGNKTCY